MPSRTLWLWIFVCLLGVTALLGMFALLLPRIPFEEELLLTSALLTGYSLLGLMASVTIARRRLLVVGWSAAGMLVLSLATFLLLTWGDGWIDWPAEEIMAKCGLTALLLGLMPTHALLLMLADFRRAVSQWARWATIAAACCAGTLCITLIWEMWDPLGYRVEDWIGRLTGAAALPAALGTIAVPILARIEYMNRREAGTETIDRHVPVGFRCPRCAAESEQPANQRFVCPGCGLRAMITLSEPRCACGYLLHGLPEPICPECGRAVSEDLWWRAANQAGGGVASDA